MHSNLLLFDLDGTLTEARQVAEPHMIDCLQTLRQQASVAIVSGTDIPKIIEQLFGQSISQERLYNTVDYVFGENGTVAQCVDPTFFCNEGYSFHEHLGEAKYQRLVNFLLIHIAHLNLPYKRGTFLELRSGILNVSPIGRNCSRAERVHFAEYDHQFQIRQNLIEQLKSEFKDYDLQYTIGGQISIDIYLKGWDKRLCLQRLEEKNMRFNSIHFFGDKTSPGGNDHTIFIDPRVVGHTVNHPNETLEKLKSLGFALDKGSLLQQSRFT